MKTNQQSNRTTNGANRRGPIRTRATNQRTTGLSGVKSRIGKPGISKAIKPKGDLRQVLASKVKPSSPNKPSTTPVSSNVKSRLGLQSRTARLEALKEAKAQLKSAQTKKPINLKDANSSKSQIKTSAPPMAAKSRPDQRNQLNRNPASNPIRQDRDRSFKDRNMSTRRPIERSSFRGDYRSRNERNAGLKSVAQPIIIQPQYIPTSQPIIYQQASHHHSSYDNAPNRFVSRAEANSAGTEVMSPMGNSVLVSNLSPKITDDEVAELFGDIGPLMNVQIINSSTALVTYFAAQHASKAVKVYNYRLLDGIAMNCTILPSSTSATQQSSSQQPLYSGRMYSDSMPASSRNSLRQNYHLGL